MTVMEHTAFDPSWVEAARQGDQDATTRLYEHCRNSVYLTIRAAIHCDKDTAEDLTQDTLFKAFQKLDTLEDPAKYPAWVKSIAQNTAISYLRQSKPLLFAELSEDADLDVSLEIEDTDPDGQPELAMDRKETARLLREILNTLPSGQRLAMIRYYSQGKDVREIAQELNRSESTIRVQLRNGRKSVEKKVRELEKREGIKLYSAAPFAFFLTLLQDTAASDAVLLGEMLGAGGAASGAAAAGTAGGAVKSAVATKIIAGVLAASVAGGGALMAYNASKPEPMDLFQDYKVAFQGENGSGIAAVYYIDGYGLNYALSENTGLSNGDTVTLTLTAPNGDDLYEYCVEQYDFAPTASTREYTVSGLEEAE